MHLIFGKHYVISQSNTNLRWKIFLTKNEWSRRSPVWLKPWRKAWQSPVNASPPQYTVLCRKCYRFGMELHHCLGPHFLQASFGGYRLQVSAFAEICAYKMRLLNICPKLTQHCILAFKSKLVTQFDGKHFTHSPIRAGRPAVHTPYCINAIYLVKNSLNVPTSGKQASYLKQQWSCPNYQNITKK